MATEPIIVQAVFSFKGKNNDEVSYCICHIFSMNLIRYRFSCALKKVTILRSLRKKMEVGGKVLYVEKPVGFQAIMSRNVRVC